VKILQRSKANTAEAPTMVIRYEYTGKHRVEDRPMAGITVDVIVAAAFRRLDRDNGYATHSRAAS